MLEQIPQPQRAAGVISVLYEGPDRDALHQFAASFPRSVNMPLVIEELSLQPQCDFRRCTITASGAPVHLILRTFLLGGFNVCVRIAAVDAQRPIRPGSDRPHFDDVVFMQLSSMHTANSACCRPSELYSTM